MPKRKTYAGRRVSRKRKRSIMRRRGTKIVRMPRPLRPRNYFFQRSFVENVVLNPAAVPADWQVVDNGYCRSQPFKLSDLPQYQEFTNMFAQYRILAVKQDYYFSDTVSTNTGSAPTQTLGSRQLMLYSVPNAQGTNNVANMTEGFFMQSQSAKKRLCLNTLGKPVGLYHKCKQLSRIFSGELGNQDFIKIKPKFVSTAETEAQHYGLDVRIQRVDNNAFSHGSSAPQADYAYPTVKIITKLYIQCRQVK